MHTFVPSTCARLAWQCLSKSSIVLLSPGIPNARTRMTFNVPGHWREMSSFPVPSAFLSVFTTRVARGVVGPIELMLGVVIFIPLTSPVLRRSPRSLVASADFVVTSSAFSLPLSVSFCLDLTVVGWVRDSVGWVRGKILVSGTGVAVVESLEMPEIKTTVLF